MKKLFFKLFYTKQIQIFRLHIEIFLMVVFFLECSGFIPDINLQGTEYMNNGVVIFRFNCSSNIGFKGCTVEGILDNRTHDNIRYANNECFHKDGKCTLECCECFSDCKVFIWNVTILENTLNNSFGCQSRIEANGITYKALVFIRHNANGFTISNKTVDPIKGYKPIITIRPSISDVPSGTKIGWKISTLIILPVLLVMSIVLCIIICRCLRLRKQKYKVTKKTIEPVSSDQNTFQEKIAVPSDSNTIHFDTEPTNLETLRCAGTEQPRFSTASTLQSETNRKIGTEQPCFSTASTLQIETNRNIEISNEKSENNRRQLKKHNSDITEMKLGKSVGDLWNVKKYKKDRPDLKKRHSWSHADMNGLVCVRNQDSELEEEQLISEQPENGEDMEMLVYQNSPYFQNKRRSFSQ